MADKFDRFLAEALAPPQREADRAFVARVQTHIALEERLAAQRRSIVRQLGMELVALLAIAVGVWWLSRAAPMAGFFADSTWLALCVLLSLFALLVVALVAPTAGRAAPVREFSTA